MLKKLLSYVVVLTLIASYFIYNADADEVDNDCLSLPVQLFDFDADGLFYEYELFQGMDTLGGQRDPNTEVTTGLIETDLVNGKPVYKRSTIENTAQMIRNNLISGKYITSEENEYRGNKFETFKKFAENNNTPGKGEPITIDASFSDNTEHTKETQIETGQWIYLYYGQSNTENLTFKILDANNNILVDTISLNSGTYDKSTWWRYMNIYVPNGTGYIKFVFTGTNGCGINRLTITPKGDVLPLGDYDTTVSKYNAGGLTTIEQCTSCMDYAYLRLSNFFNTDFYLNKLDNTYNSMVLKKNGTSYIFDSDKQIEYNKDNHTFYNADVGGDSSGFFPLDHLDNEHLKQDINDVNSKHNYHFGMIVDGHFIYNRGSNQIFNFTGDDDVYVFINDKLVIDLGGAHKKASASVNIDEYARTHNLVDGQSCSLKLFYLERRTTDSNCKIETNISLTKNVNYKFVSGTEGKELPEVIVRKTPSDANEYYDGDTATINESNRTFEDVVVADGVWKFISWDNISITIPEKNTFVGTWVFTPKTVDNENNNSSNENTDPDEGNQEDKKPTIEGNDKDDKKPEVTDKKDTDKKDSINKVKTGDSTVISIYLVMMMVACLGVIHILKKD